MCTLYEAMMYANLYVRSYLKFVLPDEVVQRSRQPCACPRTRNFSASFTRGVVSILHEHVDHLCALSHSACGQLVLENS